MLIKADVTDFVKLAKSATNAFYFNFNWLNYKIQDNFSVINKNNPDIALNPKQNNKYVVKSIFYGNNFAEKWFLTVFLLQNDRRILKSYGQINQT